MIVFKILIPGRNSPNSSGKNDRASQSGAFDSALLYVLASNVKLSNILRLNKYSLRASFWHNAGKYNLTITMGVSVIMTSILKTRVSVQCGEVSLVIYMQVSVTRAKYTRGSTIAPSMVKNGSV
jgi:hypothetical protein